MLASVVSHVSSVVSWAASCCQSEVFKNVDYDACIAVSYEVVKNQHFQSTVWGGRKGVTKKST